MSQLRDIENQFAIRAYGMTKAEAHQRGICISCKKPPVNTTELGMREYALSAICETCFDKEFPPEEEDHG